ncbi:uncharacterized protein ATC70_007409 [Mucor velutinosus]|uniref:Uncharacterized protein n=1 Tax=Mucor velutinosus TaxID=708070 RepID=A0AAN7HJJ0_9FUNG|nr:hypothetical protein ATC70_007409 [Mucor velutinosus]
MNVQAQGIKVAVLSPTANEEFYLGEKLFFDYAPLDSSIKQLNIFMDSFGKINSEVAIKLVADISKAPNGTYNANDHTYNKYSLYYTIPASLPIENEAFQISFETSEGDIVIPIKIKAPLPATTTSAQVSTSVAVHVTEIILPTTTVTANSTTVIHTASPLDMVTRSALLNSVTSMMSTATHSSATPATPAASSSQTPVSSVSNISTSSFPQPVSSSSFSPTLSLSLNPSTSSASWTGLFSASLIASTTPIPPDPESFMQSSAARNYMQNSEFSFIAATLLALLLVRLLLV